VTLTLIWDDLQSHTNENVLSTFLSITNWLLHCASLWTAERTDIRTDFISSSHRRCFGGRSSAPDPAGGAHDAPEDPLVGWGGGHPLPKNPTSILAPWALGARAFGASAILTAAPSPL